MCKPKVVEVAEALYEHYECVVSRNECYDQVLKWMNIQDIVEDITRKKQSPQGQALLSKGDSGEDNLCDECEYAQYCNQMKIPVYKCGGYKPNPNL